MSRTGLLRYDITCPLTAPTVKSHVASVVGIYDRLSYYSSPCNERMDVMGRNSLGRSPTVYR